MIRTEREKTREVRKLNVIESFISDETQFTNQIAKKIDVVWPVADRLLNELVDEGRLFGDKVKGYRLHPAPKKEGLRDKIKHLLRFSR